MKTIKIKIEMVYKVFVEGRKGGRNGWVGGVETKMMKKMMMKKG